MNEAPPPEEPRDPYVLAVAALWLSVPAMALRFWLAWDRLPARIAMHFDDRWRPNGWGPKEQAVYLAFGLLAVVLVPFTPICLAVRGNRPSHSWPVLILTALALVVMMWGGNLTISHNLPRKHRSPPATEAQPGSRLDLPRPRLREARPVRG